MPDKSRALCINCGLERRDAPDGMLFKSFRLEVKADVEKMTVEGLASTFEPPEEHDSHGDIIDRNAFDSTILDDGPAGADRIKMLWQHWQPMGVATSLIAKDDGLHFIGRAARTKTNEERIALIRDRAVDSLSIGFRTLAAELVETFRTPWGAFVRKLLKIRLHEISPVTFGSNHNALISKSFGEAMIETRSGLLVKASTRCECDLCDRSDDPKGAIAFTKKNEKALRAIAKTLGASKEKIEALLASLADTETDEDGKESPAPKGVELTIEEQAALQRAINVANDTLKRL